MLVDVRVPVLAESIAEATLLSWHKNVGDPVKRGDSLVDLETDKVTLEVAALNDGILSEILKGNGATVQSDEIIAHIDTEAGVAEDPASAAPDPVAETAALQQSDHGDEQSSLLHAAATSEQSDHEAEQQSWLTQDASGDSSPKLSPAVRNLIDEHQLDVDDIPAKLGDTRITKEDIIRHIEDDQLESAPVASTAEDQTGDDQDVPRPIADDPVPPAPVANVAEVQVGDDQAVSSEDAPAPALDDQAKNPPSPQTSQERPQEKVPMTRLRRRTAERLLTAQHENAILTTFNEINMQAVIDIRAQYREEFESAHGIKLGFMSFFAKAVVESLKKFPLINASIDGDNIVYHGYFDIGIAVSSPHGLVVPVIRDADLLSLAEIETQIRAYGEKARDRKLMIDDLSGGTFTITNGGVFGSLLSTPIINPPQSAILGMHKIQQRPIAENGQVVIRPMMYLALSYDHRIIDGREAVQYLVSIKNQLEDPARLLLQL